MKIKNIGVIGQGFVGTAVREGLRHVFPVVTYDVKYGEDLKIYDAKDMFVVPANNRIADLTREVEGPIFVCVPTPMKSDGSADISIVESVVKEINDTETSKSKIVVIKSTVPPGTTDYLNQTYNSVLVCFNPEFLREATAIEDFKNQDRIIVGGPHAATAVVKQLYMTAYPEVPVTKTSASIAEMVKYTTNVFLAVKVALANELKQICDAMPNVDYDKVIEYATKDKRLGYSHWSVPGPDGHKGFGLTCFPKDLNALMKKAEELGVDPKVMKAAWEKNLEVRPERDWEQLLGRAVV